MKSLLDSWKIENLSLKLKMNQKRGNILTENIIFVVLNVAFLVILALFLFSKTSDTGVLEEKYAKQIALLIDAAEPVMTISLDMKEAIEGAADENYPLDQIVMINENFVTVRLSGDSQGYTYSFFNSVSANANFNTTSGTGYYININEK